MAINWHKLVVRVSKSPEFQTQFSRKTVGQTLPSAVLEQVQLPGIPGLAASSWLWPWHWGHCWTWAIVILEQLQLLYHTVGSHFVYFCRASVRCIDDLLQHTVRFAYSIHSKFLAWPRDDVWLVSRQCLDVHQGCFPLFCSFTGMYDLTVGGNGNDYPLGPWATECYKYLYLSVVTERNSHSKIQKLQTYIYGLALPGPWSNVARLLRWKLSRPSSNLQGASGRMPRRE